MWLRLAESSLCRLVVAWAFLGNLCVSGCGLKGMEKSVETDPVDCYIL